MKQHVGYVHNSGYDVMAEVQGAYKATIPYLENGIVLDLGAHIGSYCYMALNHGASKVYAVEASRRNYTFLQSQPFVKDNLARRIKVYHKAVIADEQHKQKVRVYEGTGKSTTADGIIYRRGRGAGYMVDAIGFKDLLIRTSPTILKIDVEGSERHYDYKDLPDCIQCLAIELHMDNDEHHTICEHICNILSKQFSNLLFRREKLMFSKHFATELIFAK